MLALGLALGANRSARAEPFESVLDVGVDVLHPTQSGRQLHTLNTNFLVLQKKLETIPLELRFGALITRTTGSINQLEGNFDEGTLHTATLDSPAWGYGPQTQQRLTLGRVEKFTFSVDTGEAMIFYDRGFPAGGRHYNFQLQAGPTLGFALPGGSKLSLGYRWMHISNGSGLGPQNPSYQPAGFAVEVHIPL